jgi:hypothetical protein
MIRKGHYYLTDGFDAKIYKRQLKDGSGKKVTGRKQVVAIGLSKAHKHDAKVPKQS